MRRGKAKIRGFLAVIMASLMLLGGTITSQAVYFDTGSYTTIVLGNLYHNNQPNQKELDEVAACYKAYLPEGVKNFLVNNGIKVYIKGDEVRSDALAIAYAPLIYMGRNNKVSKIGEPGYVVYYANSAKNYYPNSLIHEIGHEIDYYASISSGYFTNSGYGISMSQEWLDLYYKYYADLYKIDALTRANVCRSNVEGWAELVRVLYVNPNAILEISPALYSFAVSKISAVIGADATPVQKQTQQISVDTFDYVAYADAYPDVKAVYGYDRQLLFTHYIQYGMYEGRKASFTGASTPTPSPTPGVTYTNVESKAGFDYSYYADSYPDLKSAFGYDKELLWNHYIQFGKAEGRVARFVETTGGNTTGTYANFDYKFYADSNPDVKAALGYNKKNLWNHYQKYGKKEGRAVNFL